MNTQNIHIICASHAPFDNTRDHDEAVFVAFVSHAAD